MNIFARFFTFNAFLAVFFIFSKTIFENNYFLSAQLLWIVLMTTIPLGAAAYSRFSSRIDKVLGQLFYVCMIYFIAASALFLRWSPTASFGDVACLTLFICGFVIFAPVWFTVGILEMNLYQALSRANKDTLWAAYLFGVLGLLLGSLIPLYGLSVHSPFRLGILLSALFLVYARTAALRFTWGTTLIAAVSVVLLATNSYIRDPVSQIQRFASSASAPEIKADIWGRDVRLTIARSQEGLYGFYNSAQHWFPYRPSGDAFKGVSLYEKLASLMPRHATIAVIGAGGCKQLAPFLLNEPDRIYAIDIVPGLFDVLADLGVAVLGDPRVSAVTRDGRKFIEQSRETFDLIFFPRTNSTLMLSKSLFEPSQLLFSLEALQACRRKLGSNGILAISNWKIALDAAGSNYAATLKAAGFEVNRYSTEDVVLILAATNRKTADRFAQALGTQDSVDIAAGKIITDDKPFYASTAFSRNSVRTSLICLALLFLGGLALFICYPGQRQAVLPPFFCGVNYTLILLIFQLLLFPGCLTLWTLSSWGI